MQDQLTARLKELARRAGLTGVPPVAVAAALALCALIVVSAAWRWWPRGTVADSAPAQVGTAAAGEAGAVGEPPAGEVSASAGVEPGSASASSTVYVHVVGAVRHPGMFELSGGARIADAVGAAGGLTGNAAQAGVNLARPVTDGEQVVVPTIDEYAKGAQPLAGGANTAPAGGAGAATGALVNVNTADAAALDTLPGVGPSTAAKIVAEREANGPFASPDDLARVAGIGPKKLEELKPRVSVN